VNVNDGTVVQRMDYDEFGVRQESLAFLAG